MKKIALGFCFLLGGLIFSTSALAAESTSPSKHPPVAGHGLLPGPLTGDKAVEHVNENFLPSITNYALIFLLTISVLMIIIGGLFYIASSGDSEMKTKGKDIIVWTIAGVAIAILSYTLISLVVNTNFGIE